MNLCIDIGNTATKAALYDKGLEVNYFSDFKLNELKELLKDANLQVLVSKSGENNEIDELLRSTNNYNLLTADIELPIALNYKTPETLGSDRIAVAVAAAQEYEGKNVLLIDLGTCLTIDLIDQNSVFQGGVIAPGIHMRFRSMHEFTSALPMVEYNKNITFPGKSTVESLQVGVYQSIINEVRGYIEILAKQYPDLVVVDCSGDKINFEMEINFKIFAHPKFVLQGLNIIADQHA